MLFESFLQNYIKNFEEQEANNSIMDKKQLARLFLNWKQSAQSSHRQVHIVRTSHSSPPAQPQKKAEKQETNESQSFSLNKEVEMEYMELINQFRRVFSFNIGKNSSFSDARLEKGNSYSSPQEKIINNPS